MPTVSLHAIDSIERVLCRSFYRGRRSKPLCGVTYVVDRAVGYSVLSPLKHVTSQTSRFPPSNAMPRKAYFRKLHSNDRRVVGLNKVISGLLLNLR